jgi:hypothetical protein
MSGVPNVTFLLVNESSNFKDLINPGSGHWKYLCIMARPCEHIITENLVGVSLTANTQCPIFSCPQVIQSFIPGLEIDTFGQIVRSTPERDPRRYHEFLAKHVRSAAPSRCLETPDMTRDSGMTEEMAAEEDPVIQLQNGQECYKVKNYIHAVKWFGLSANQGNATAMRELAHCYTFGHGVNASSEESNEWLAEAAKVDQEVLAAKMAQEKNGGEELGPQSQQRRKFCPCCCIS